MTDADRSAAAQALTAPEAAAGPPQAGRAAESLTAGLRRSALLVLLGGLGLLSGANMAASGSLPDPTRPPNGLVIDSGAGRRGPGSASGAGAAAAAAGGPPGNAPAAGPRAGAAAPGPSAAAAAAPASAPSALAEPPPLPVLQSVQISSRTPANVLLDGRMLRVGDQIGEWRVLSIDVEGVVLRGPAGQHRLSLLQGAAKQAPGSITATGSTRYQAASAAAASPLANAAAGPPPGMAERTR